MRAILIGLLFIGLTNLSFAQNETGKLLAEVEIYARNYNYLKSVNSKDVLPPISLLERKVANFDVKNLKVYRDDYDTYKVLFFISKGNIVAHYDNNSNIIRTYEKFKDIKLPISVLRSIAKKFPNWSISDDLYLVNYHHNKGVKKRYKITLMNSGERIKIKTDENGEVL